MLSSHHYTDSHASMNALGLDGTFAGGYVDDAYGGVQSVVSLS